MTPPPEQPASATIVCGWCLERNRVPLSGSEPGPTQNRQRPRTLRPARIPIYGLTPRLTPRSEVIEELQLLPVNDHLAPAQFDELVLGQEAEESLLMPDE